jgi:hypothetical protein
MLGWHLAAAGGRKGGVPAAVAALLLRGLAESGWVSFFAASAPAASAEVRVSRIDAPSIGGQARAGVVGLPRDVYLVSTRQPRAAEAAFGASLFSWAAQGQMLLLWSEAGPPPALGGLDMETLTATGSPGVASLEAILLPGADGDVAALVSKSEPIEKALLMSLRAEAENAQFGWRVLSEDEFSKAM